MSFCLFNLRSLQLSRHEPINLALPLLAEKANGSGEVPNHATNRDLN